MAYSRVSKNPQNCTPRGGKFSLKSKNWQFDWISHKALKLAKVLVSVQGGENGWLATWSTHVKELGFEFQPQFTSYEILVMLLDFFVPRIPHLETGANKITYLIKLL